MAMNGGATPKSKSPQKRKLANHNTQFNAWSSFVPSSPQLSRSPQRKRFPNVGCVSPAKANGSATSDVELEDGMALINTLRDISIRKTLTKTRPRRAGDHGSPESSLKQFPELQHQITTPQEAVPAPDPVIQPEVARSKTTRIVPDVVNLEADSNIPPPTADAPQPRACKVSPPPGSDMTTIQEPSLDVAPLTAPIAEPLPTITQKIRVVGRRIESDSEDDNDNAHSSFPTRPMGASSQRRNDIEVMPISDANVMSTVGITEICSDNEEPPTISTGTVSSLPRYCNGPARPPHVSTEGAATQSVEQMADIDTSLDVAEGVLHFSRVPASPSKRTQHSTPPNFPSSEQAILVHSDSSDSDEDEVAQLLDRRVFSRRRRNKRLSVWSIKDETEVLATSSSETDEDTDHYVYPSIRTSSQPHSSKKVDSAVPPGAQKPPSRALDKSSSTSGARPPSKKRAREMLARYAEELYTSLNGAVFSAKLPPVKTPQSNEPNPCEIIWSNTLKKTAGRAVVKSTISKAAGSVPKFTVSIELAVKVVDSEERIRHTLSHEMCHLAVWVIDQVKENDHGPSFKAWAAKIMRARKDITITTRHSYEIAYKYEWECVDCSGTYGRHSKSIRPSEQVCGRCKGKLKPLFEEKESKASGWTLFVKEQMGPMLASNPGMTRGGAMKEIGKLWRLRGQPSATDIEGMVEGLSSLSMGT